MNNNSPGDSRVDHSGFRKEEYTVDNTTTVVYRAGSGTPLVFLHGGGTWHGLEFAKAWTEHFDVILPYHPGFGQSHDNPCIGSVHDYLLHYRELFDLMGLTRFNLVGFSFGGRLAAEYAIQFTEQVAALVLVAPAGLDVAEFPQPDFTVIPPEEIPSYLVHDIHQLLPYLPASPDDDEFNNMRMREGGSVGKMLRNGTMVNPKLRNWLHRLKMPTLLLWGNQDRIVPPGQAPHWQALIPDVRLATFENAGHLVLDESAAAQQAVIDFLNH